MDKTQNQLPSLENDTETTEEKKTTDEVLENIDKELSSLVDDETSSDVSAKVKDEEQSDTGQLKESPDQVLKHKCGLVLSVLHEVRGQIQSAIELMEGTGATPKPFSAPHGDTTASTNVIEGVFNGQHMTGPDGKEYTVPANYASKSKLVEGDILKLTITGEGRFIFKQIQPIERKRIIGTLTQDQETRQYAVAYEGKSWKVLTASVTYYKGSEGDEVILLVPAKGETGWGAVENIMKQSALAANTDVRSIE